MFKLKNIQLLNINNPKNFIFNFKRLSKSKFNYIKSYKKISTNINNNTYNNNNIKEIKIELDIENKNENYNININTYSDNNNKGKKK